MSKIGKTQAATQEEDLLIGETPAIFSNKLYLTRVPLGLKITFAETFRVGREDKVRPRTSIFLQHQDVLALYNLLETAAKNIKVETNKSAKVPENGSGIEKR